MKIMKRIATIILSLCLIIPCFSMVAYAADGRIMFTDLSTTAGETISINCVIKSGAGEAIGDVDITLNYDSESLKFLKGDDVTGSNGTLNLSGSGNGSDSQIQFTLEFQALKEGEAKITISDYNAKLQSGSALKCTEGSSTIKIAAGSGEVTPEAGGSGEGTGIKVKVAKKEYELSEAFKDAEMPAEFTRAKTKYEGQEVDMAVQETNGMHLAYLVDEEGTGEFFFFDEENGTFSPYEMVDVSDTYSIVLMNDVSGITLPKEYKKVKLTLNNNDFPAWQSTKNEGFYVVYALDSGGEKGLYQYDSLQGTYQRFFLDTEKENNTLLGKVEDFLSKHLNYLVLFGGLGFLLLIIGIIILGIKLHNRNGELDELYEEYNIGEDEEDLALGNSALKDTSSKKKGLFKRNNDEDDEFETYNDEDFDDYEEDDYDEYEYEDDDYEDSEEEDIDESLERVPDRRRKKDNDHDEFTIDFIDLDL